MKKLIKNIFKKAGYTVANNRYMLKQELDRVGIIDLDFDHVLSKYLILDKIGMQPFFFLQIGAFDGISCDPIHKYIQKYKWSGIMLEPQPKPFKELVDSYQDNKNIKVVNAALSDTKGDRTLYILQGDHLPAWAKSMASFSRGNILKHECFIDEIEKYVVSISVPTINFDALISENGITTIDLLQIDTEGFDSEILSMFPFEKIKPALIHFESKHIEKKTLEDTLDRLISFGYMVARDGQEDMVAVYRQQSIEFEDY